MRKQVVIPIEKVPPHIIKMLYTYGKRYKSAALPEDIKLGKMGRCFDNTIMSVVENRPKYKYVEGVAIDPEDGQTVYHSWLTDGDNAFDNTWRITREDKYINVPLPFLYLGIEIPTLIVVDFLKTVKRGGVMWNLHEHPGPFTDYLKTLPEQNHQDVIVPIYRRR